MDFYVKYDDDNAVVSYPYNIEQIRADNPNTSFPASFTDAILQDQKVSVVAPSTPPSIDGLVSTITEINPALVDGVWTQQWQSSQVSQSKAEENVRRRRTQLLGETDYLALSDHTLSTEMTTYRQALRDIPSQEGFPFNVTWPTKP